MPNALIDLGVLGITLGMLVVFARRIRRARPHNFQRSPGWPVWDRRCRHCRREHA